MSLAVCSAAWGDHAEEIAALSFPGFKEYARRTGAEFVTLPPGPPGLPPVFWKNEVRVVLERMDRVLWLDADCLVRPDCPDLFGLVPPDRFAAHDELEYATDTEVYLRHQDVVGVCLEDVLPVPNTRGRHFNAGVYLAPARCAVHFNYPIGVPRTLVGEQSRLNTRLFLTNEDVYCLPECFNRLVYHHPPRRWQHSAYIAHFAGMGIPEVRLRDMSSLHTLWYK